MDISLTGVILLAFGGPDSPEAIEPFMKNLMGGRKPPSELVEKVKARYRLIGGSSPLPDTTRKQAEKLQELLGNRYLVEIGMRYWHPFIYEGLQKLVDKGAKKVVAVSLAPFYSKVSTGTYEEELVRSAGALMIDKSDILISGPLFENHYFIEAIAERVKEGIKQFPLEARDNIQIIFSAHSLPVSYIKDGDPYSRQFENTVQRVGRLLGLKKWYLAYQSKGGGQGEWLGPMVEEVMDDINKKGYKDVLVVPAGFVSDHIETLYDIDIAQKQYAEALGLNFKRTVSLNTSGLFIKALADLVQKYER